MSKRPFITCVIYLTAFTHCALHASGNSFSEEFVPLEPLFGARTWENLEWGQHPISHPLMTHFEGATPTRPAAVSQDAHRIPAPSTQQRRASATTSTSLKPSALKVTQMRPAELSLQSVRKGSVQTRRKGDGPQKKKKICIPVRESKAHLEEAELILKENKRENFPKAIEAFYKCYAHSPGHRWQGCLGLAKTYLAIGNHESAQESLRRISDSKTCPQGIREEALSVSLSLMQALVQTNNIQIKGEKTQD
ncbi:MAG: hypothetical protein C0514_05790 [Candidatus Puniceispirillum sp.]|nr:hypothetical protein [Candidatus Puniceispirillum sp.]